MPPEARRPLGRSCPLRAFKLQSIVIQICGLIIRIVDGRDWNLAKQPQVRPAVRCLLVTARKKEDHGMPKHGRLQRLQNRMSTEEGEQTARSCNQRQLRFVDRKSTRL